MHAMTFTTHQALIIMYTIVYNNAQGMLFFTNDRVLHALGMYSFSVSTLYTYNFLILQELDILH